MHPIKISLTLTPIQPPTLFSNTSISVELNFNTVSVADKPPIPQFPKIVRHACPKDAAILVSNFDPINVSFNVKVSSEAHPDGVALRNLDFLDNIEVVLIVFRVVR